MSNEVALAFVKKVAEDAALQAKLRQLTAKDAEAGLPKIAAEAGFGGITLDEYLTAAETHKAQPDRPLTDEELSAIAGGMAGTAGPLCTQFRSGCGDTMER